MGSYQYSTTRRTRSRKVCSSDSSSNVRELEKVGLGNHSKMRSIEKKPEPRWMKVLLLEEGKAGRVFGLG